MEQIIKDFRDGIFSLQTRRFGTAAELIVRKKYNLLETTVNQHHDATDSKGKRVEIKFSRVLKENKESITKDNILTQAVNSSMAKRAIRHNEMGTFNFDCNIQQVKRKEFDMLYYGLFFADKIAVFAIKSDEILNIIGYSDFQHKGNTGEGQFHLTNDSIDEHLKKNLVDWITYEEVYKMFSK